MNHNPLRQIVLRISILGVLFGLFTLGFYLLGLPYSYAWGGMLAMMSWTTILKHVL